MHRNRNAKIVATLGPASDGPETIRALVKAGVDVFRLNFSHGSRDDHRQRCQRVRQIEHEVGYPLGILLDLQGPKLRIGEFADHEVQLDVGQNFQLDTDPSPGTRERVCLPHEEVLSALESGAELLLDDGRTRLEVIETYNKQALTRVKAGGQLSNHKGVNVPDILLPLCALTDKDEQDLAFGLTMSVDWVALSFVQRPQDVSDLRQRVNGRASILAKLEKPAAIGQLQAIIDAADAIMVARGDLGVEVPPERVPGLQKRIIHDCRRAGKPVVVATQMLESMIDAPVATRAEVSDVANAALEGSDAVMLSAETAVGAYPIEAVAVMDRILSTVEQDEHYRAAIEVGAPVAEATTPDAICSALRQVAHVLPVSVTVTYTQSGFTSLRAARERPEAPILCLTPHMETARRLTLGWGLYPLQIPAAADIDEVVRVGVERAVREGLARSGDPIAITAGLPLDEPGHTNVLRIAEV